MPTMPYAAPSSTNVFIPNSDLAQQLRISYSRNVADFPLNQWTKMMPKLKKERGHYLTIKPNQNFRIRHDDLRNHVWHDGHDRPQHQWNQKLFQWVPYDTTRYDFGYVLGRKTIDEADWEIESEYAGMAAQQAMTARTILANAALEGASWGKNAAAPGALLKDATRNWLNGTATKPNIRKSLLRAARVCNLLTGGVIEPKDLILKINPTLAIELGNTEEVYGYLKESRYAHPIQTGEINDQWGLPDVLYGFPVVVDDTVQDTERENSGDYDNPVYIQDDDTAYLLSRPGGLVGKAGTPAFSTVTGFFYGSEMDVESMYDDRNRRVEGHVGFDCEYQVTTVLGGFKLTDVLG